MSNALEVGCAGAVTKKPRQKQKKELFWKRVKEQKYLLIMLFPLVAAVFIFRYIPVSGWLMAFKDYQIGQSIWDAKWVGLQNFKEFFGSTGDAYYVIRNTIVINVLSILCNLFLSCLTAVLLNEIAFKRFKTFVQTSSFFPYFVSWAIAYAIFNSFLSANTGFLNLMLIKLGVIEQGLNILGDKKYSWILMVFVNVWKALGYNTVIFLSAITSIDQTQYEAADIDGASRLQKILYVTLPGVASTFVVLLIINSGWIFTVNFEEFVMFTNMTNYETMEVFDMYIYRFGLKLLDFSYATAVGVVKTLVSITLLITVNTISKKFADRSIF